MGLRAELHGSTAMHGALSFIFNNQMNNFHAAEARLTGRILYQNPLRWYH